MPAKPQCVVDLEKATGLTATYLPTEKAWRITKTGAWHAENNEFNYRCTPTTFEFYDLYNSKQEVECTVERVMELIAEWKQMSTVEEFKAALKSANERIKELEDALDVICRVAGKRKREEE